MQVELVGGEFWKADQHRPEWGLPYLTIHHPSKDWEELSPELELFHQQVDDLLVSGWRRTYTIRDSKRDLLQMPILFVYENSDRKPINQDEYYEIVGNGGGFVPEFKAQPEEDSTSEHPLIQQTLPYQVIIDPIILGSEPKPPVQEAVEHIWAYNYYRSGSPIYMDLRVLFIDIMLDPFKTIVDGQQ